MLGFLDTCSDTNFITKAVKDELKLPVIRTSKVKTSSIEGSHSHYREVVEFTLSRRGFKCVVKAHVIEEPFHLPKKDLPAHIWQEANKKSHKFLSVTREQLAAQMGVDLLLCVNYASALSEGPLKSLSDGYALWQTKLGDIIFGGNASLEDIAITMACQENQQPQKTLDSLWSMESFGLGLSDIDELTAGQYRALKLMEEGTKRVRGGRYERPLLWKQDNVHLLGNRGLAFKRALQLEKRLQRKPHLKPGFDEAMKSYIERKDASLVSTMTYDEAMKPVHNQWHLPVGIVVRPGAETTKVRAVMDGAAINSKGESLNSHLLPGPSIHPLLFGILNRLRVVEVACVSDVSKMYLSINVCPKDRPFQRYFWRENPEDPMGEYQLNVTTFGLADSPFAAMAVLKTHSEFLPDGRAKNSLKRDLFVDDWLTGADTAEEALEMYALVRSHMSKAGFEFKKWISNSKEFMMAIPEEDRGEQGNIVLGEQTEGEDEDGPKGPPDKSDQENRKALGVAWNTRSDTLGFPEAPQPDMSKKVTKRTIASGAARIFDPLGLISPFLLPAKVILQKCWKLKQGWDEPVPENLAEEWRGWVEQIPQIAKFQVPRKIASRCNKDTHHLIAMGDASSYGIGVVIYLRSKSEPHVCHLVFSKAKVAPSGTSSIARKELLGALLTSKLAPSVAHELDLDPTEIIYFTDSLTTLQWLKGDSSQWKIFVANRVSAILEVSDRNQWFHIPGEFNCADYPSRGLTAQELTASESWKHGPPFISLPRENWPASKKADFKDLSISQIEEIERERKTASKSTTTYLFQIIATTPEDLTLD